MFLVNLNLLPTVSRSLGDTWQFLTIWKSYHVSTMKPPNPPPLG